MRVLMLTQWFQPEPNLKGLPFAKALQARGHQVEVLTGFPNYPQGRLYPGYRLRPWQREVMDGIPVVRVPLYPSHDRSGLRRIANYSSFALAAATLGARLVSRPDVLYAYHPPGTIGLPAVLLKHLFRVPLVYDIQDLWPDAVVASGMLTNRVVVGLLDLWCSLVYRQADRIVVLSPGFREALIARGLEADRIEVVYNWSDERAMAATWQATNLPKELEAPGRLVVLFAGTMGMAQGLDSILDAALLCQQQELPVRFAFVGGGIDKERLRGRAQSMGLGNVAFLPVQPMEAMGPILQAAQVLLVHLVDNPLFRITIPSKTQAYLAAGKPILMAVHGDAADLVTRAKAGIVAEPSNPSSIAQAVRRFVEMNSEERRLMGERGRSFYQRELNMRAGVIRFERIFREACGRQPEGNHSRSEETP
ncbi:MAG: glycosyltransferase family 4 protein [Bradymonadales bacterium]|nr:glycosyltransferase family 4 protein [Bradymonadales bacterium]